MPLCSGVESNPERWKEEEEEGYGYDVYNGPHMEAMHGKDHVAPPKVKNRLIIKRSSSHVILCPGKQSAKARKTRARVSDATVREQLPNHPIQ